MAKSKKGKKAVKRFLDDLKTRGEAVPATPGKRLPLDVTHVIEKAADGSETVKRVRLKTF